MEGGVHLGVGPCGGRGPLRGGGLVEGGVFLGVGPCGGRGLLMSGALWREGSS